MTILFFVPFVLLTTWTIIELVTAPHIKAQRARQRAHEASLEKYQVWDMARKPGTQRGRDWDYDE